MHHHRPRDIPVARIIDDFYGRLSGSYWSRPEDNRNVRAEIASAFLAVALTVGTCLGIACQGQTNVAERPGETAVNSSLSP